jgi:hypothetical protein
LDAAFFRSPLLQLSFGSKMAQRIQDFEGENERKIEEKKL